MTSNDSLVVLRKVVRSQGNSARRLDSIRSKLEAAEECPRVRKGSGLIGWFLSVIGRHGKEELHGAA